MIKKILKEVNFPESYISIILGFLVIVLSGVLAYRYFTRTQPSQQPQDEQAAEEQAATESAVSGQTYTVVKSDTLWSISERAYGTGFGWSDIAKENDLTDPNRIEEGQKLVLPKEVAQKPKESQILADTTVKVNEYKVVKGDSLWKIAVNQYGDGYAWVKIARENNLANPDIIHAGNTLKIPAA